MVCIQDRNFAKMYWDLLPECDYDFNLLAFISYIIDVYDLLDVRQFNGEEYRRLSNSFIQNRVDWSDSTIDRYINRADELGIISRITDRETVFKKNSKARFIKLNVSIIGSSVGSSVGSKRTINHTNQINQTNNSEDTSPSSPLMDKNPKDSNIYSKGPEPTYPQTAEELRNRAITKKSTWDESFDYDYFFNYYEASDWKDKGGNPINLMQTLTKWIKGNKEQVKIKKNNPKHQAEPKVDYNNYRREKI